MGEGLMLNESERWLVFRQAPIPIRLRRIQGIENYPRADLGVDSPSYLGGYPRVNPRTNSPANSRTSSLSCPLSRSLSDFLTNPLTNLGTDSLSYFLSHLGGHPLGDTPSL
jgi:hypothetical protein